MCIIVVKRKGIKMPDRKVLENCFNNNPDGAGYSYYNKKDKFVYISKGYFNFDDFYKEVSNFKDEDEVVMHFRISTQGGVNPEMTHPFPLSNNKRYMKALDLKCKCAISHNGIIPMTSYGMLSKSNPDESDTSLYIRNYMYKLFEKDKEFNEQWKIDIVEETIGNSKLAIQTKDGILTIGNFIEDCEGVLFSNSSYLDNVYTYSNYKNNFDNNYTYGQGYPYASAYDYEKDYKKTNESSTKKDCEKYQEKEYEEKPYKNFTYAEIEELYMNGEISYSEYEEYLNDLWCRK